MGDDPLYSSRIIKSFCEYIEKYHPDFDMRHVLERAGIPHYQLEDEGHWLTQQQADRFYEKLAEDLGDPGLARKVGQFIPFSLASGKVSQFTVGFMTPSAAYAVLDRLYPHMSRGAEMETRSLGADEIEVIATRTPGVAEKPYQCENRLGTFEGIAKLFTGKLAAIEHDICMHTSGDRCVYRIKWIEAPSVTWKRISKYGYLIGVFVSLPALYFLPLVQGAFVALLMMLLSVGVSRYRVHLENAELSMAIANHRTMADDLLDEINTRYNNAMLIQEVGQAFSSMPDIDKLLGFTMETVRKRLHFDRGLIMLANQEGTRLVHKAGFGYGNEEEILLRSSEFHLDNPDSKGPFVVAFKEKKPFLVNDVRTIENDVSERSREVTRKLHVGSFVCVPIVYEGKAQGILAVDSPRRKKTLNQSDVNLLLGIASQIGTGINNARFYQRILESEERFRALSENAPDIIYTTDNAGRFTYVNPAWQRLLGHKREDVRGRYFVDFAREKDRRQYRKLFREVRDEKKRISGFEGIILHADGSERLFSMSGAANMDAAGNVVGIVGTFRDVTRQRLLEKQLIHASKMEAVGTLTGGIAHDFNNILQAVSGYNQLLMMKKDESHPDWRHLVNMDRLHRRATDLIRQLMLFSRKVDIEPRSVDLNEEIRVCTNFIKEIIPRMILIDLQLGAALWKIEADPVQIGQVLMNLAVNARDAMPEGGVLRMRTENARIGENTLRHGGGLNPGPYVLLHVSDTGYGMDDDTVSHIFEPFYSTKKAGEGTGLGLAVVFGIVKSHGGKIFCESEPGRGTSFHLYLPARPDSPSAETVACESKDEVKTSAAGHTTVLLVDDEESLLETTKGLLEHCGYQVLTAENGERAVDIFRIEKSNIAAVILDLQMPGMGGMRCLAELLHMDPSARVIISSGYIPGEKQQQVMGAGATGIIQKPYRHRDIVNLLKEVLDKAYPET